MASCSISSSWAKPGFEPSAWLWVFSPKYREQVAADWQEAGAGRRTMLAFEFLISAVLGLAIPMIVWALLT